MSYEVYYLENEFMIKKENFETCISLIKEYHREIVPDIKCPGGALAYPEKDMDKKMVYALSHFGWPAQLGDNGIWSIDTHHNRRGDMDMLNRISKFVESGSTIEYIGEDGKACKIEFSDMKMRVYEGVIQYTEINLTKRST